MVRSISEQIQDQLEGFRTGPNEGFVLTIGASRQQYVLFDRYYTIIEGQEFIRLCWSSHCVVCGVPILAITETKFSGLTRSCPEHRGQYHDPHTALAKQDRKAEQKREEKHYPPDFKLMITEREVDGKLKYDLLEVNAEIVGQKSNQERYRPDTMPPLARAIWDTIEEDFAQDTGAAFEDLIAKVVGRLPYDGSGRDTRRHRVIRALDGIRHDAEPFVHVMNGVAHFRHHI